MQGEAPDRLRYETKTQEAAASFRKRRLLSLLGGVYAGVGLHAALFPFLLAGKAQADTGDGLEASFGNGFTAFTAAGLAVYPFRAFLKCACRRLTQGRFAFDTFQFGRLIKNVHRFS